MRPRRRLRSGALPTERSRSIAPRQDVRFQPAATERPEPRADVPGARCSRFAADDDNWLACRERHCDGRSRCRDVSSVLPAAAVGPATHRLQLVRGGEGLTDSCARGAERSDAALAPRAVRQCAGLQRRAAWRQPHCRSGLQARRGQRLSIEVAPRRRRGHRGGTRRRTRLDRRAAKTQRGDGLVPSSLCVFASLRPNLSLLLPECVLRFADDA